MIVKVYLKGRNFYFLKVCEEFIYYKIKKPVNFDKYGNLKTHTEVLKDVLVLLDRFNNQVLSKTWRINGWSSAIDYIESLGYKHQCDLNLETLFLMSPEHTQNLVRFINKQPLEKLENLHDFKEGQIFTLQNKVNNEPLYIIDRVTRDSVYLKNIKLGFIDRFKYYRLKELLKTKLKEL